MSDNKYVDDLSSIIREHNNNISNEFWDQGLIEQSSYKDKSVLDITQEIHNHLWNILNEDEDIDCEAVNHVDSLLGQIRMKLGFPSGFYLKGVKGE